jgi:hypothetical protein
MKSHIAKMEEDINRIPILQNELLANDLQSNNGETDNFPSRNLSLQTTLSQSVFLRYPSRTPNPTRNVVVVEQQLAILVFFLNLSFVFFLSLNVKPCQKNLKF